MHSSAPWLAGFCCFFSQARVRLPKVATGTEVGSAVRALFDGRAGIWEVMGGHAVHPEWALETWSRSWLPEARGREE